MTRDEATRQMEEVRGDVESRVRRAEEDILALAAAYYYLGRDFSFSADRGLEERVDRILLELSDSLMAANDERIARTGAAPSDDPSRHGGRGRAERYDWWCSRLRDALESWAAAGFACGLGAAATLAEARRWRRNPSGSGVWERAGVAPPPGHGRGLPADIADGLTLEGQNAVNEAFNLAALEGLRRTPGVTGYRVVRGSAFDCGTCDALCAVIHPLAEACLPAHPRCLCSVVPVYGTE